MKVDLQLTPEERKEQEYYRDARFTGDYGNIWTTVEGCVFCDPKRDRYNIFEEHGVMLTINTFAYIDGHLMIIPRRHFKSVKDLTDDEWRAIRKCMYIAKKIIRKVHGLKDVQYVIRDGGIAVNSTVQDHLHIHCIPSDAPDLTVWNYRKLQYTPLENAALFRQEAKTIAKLSEKFDDKYATTETRDKKEVYREAFQKMLASKKASKAKKTARVGASIVAGDRIISMSNANVVEGVMEVEIDGAWTSPPTVSHAEERCIAHAAKDGISLHGATMLVTLSPCMMCSRLIVNSGITELHYIDDWWDQKALQFLADNGVKVLKLPYKKK